MGLRGLSKERSSKKEAPGRNETTKAPKAKKEAPGLRAKDIAKKEATKKKETPTKRSASKEKTTRTRNTTAASPKAYDPGTSTTTTNNTPNPTSTHSRVNPTSTHSRVNPTSAHSRVNPTSAHSRVNPTSTHSRVRTAGTPSAQPLLAGGESTPRRSTEQATAPKFNYQPPRIPSNPTNDSMDDMIAKVDLYGDDKYKSLMNPDDETSQEPSQEPSQEAWQEPSRIQKHVPVIQVKSQRRNLPDVIQPPAVRQQSEALTLPVSEMTTQSFEGSEAASELQPPSRTKKSRREIFTTHSVDSEIFLNRDDALWSDDDTVLVKQRIAFLCIAVSALQLGILLIQLIMCGVASVDVNPMIGPFPDAFSEWGGKNAYLMIEGHQYFRIITPVFLHVGVLHLLVNAFVQLETCAFFEREWGSGRWLTLYLISGLGCVATSSVANPDLIGVCSSGALMGLFGAKFAQVITWTSFDLHNSSYLDSVQLDQLGGVMCSASLISILSFFTYIDWSGHMGGLIAGFLGGILIFCKPIESTCTRVLWGSIGLFGLLGGAYFLGYLLLYEVAPDEDLADACDYFRNLFPEGYECECVWN